MKTQASNSNYSKEIAISIFKALLKLDLDPAFDTEGGRFEVQRAGDPLALEYVITVEQTGFSVSTRCKWVEFAMRKAGKCPKQLEQFVSLLNTMLYYGQFAVDAEKPDLVHFAGQECQDGIATFTSVANCIRYPELIYKHYYSSFEKLVQNADDDTCAELSSKLCDEYKGGKSGDRILANREEVILLDDSFFDDKKQ